MTPLIDRVCNVLSCFTACSLGTLATELDIAPDKLLKILDRLIHAKKIVQKRDAHTHAVVYKLIETQCIDENATKNQLLIRSFTDSPMDAPKIMLKVFSILEPRSTGEKYIKPIRFSPNDPQVIETTKGMIHLDDIEDFFTRELGDDFGYDIPKRRKSKKFRTREFL